MLTNVYIYLFQLILASSDVEPRCLTSGGLLQQAYRIEREFAESRNGQGELAGQLVDERTPRFRRFTEQCLASFLALPYAPQTELEQRQLWQVVKKTYFYARQRQLLIRYRDYLRSRDELTADIKDFMRLELQASTASGEQPLLLTNAGERRFFAKENAIIIVSHPRCVFSQQLRHWLNRHALATRTPVIWGVKRTVGMPLTEFIDNDAYSGYQLMLNIPAWRAITTWQTPTIYRFHKGELVQQLVGFNVRTTRLMLQWQ